jgi:hypothetical protein
MTRSRRLLAALALAAAGVPASGRARVQVLDSVGGLPAFIAGAFRDPGGYAEDREGRIYVFDRGGHTVYRVDAGADAARPIVTIGGEPGRILDASSFALEPNGTFVVADAPNGVERIQIFRPDGVPIGGFSLPGRSAPRVTLGDLVLSGIGAIAYTGRAILVSEPESGSLITEYTLSGRAFRSIGRLRETGHDEDRDLRIALNAGLPLAAPSGGYYFVFQAGVPMFRRYAQNGRLLYERHIEGPEVDPIVQGLPTMWPRRRLGGVEMPLVPPTVRTAAVDPAGRLWVSLTVPYTYVYDASGDKIRTVQFRGAGLLSPATLFFPDRHRLLVSPGCFEFRVD